MTDGGPIEPIPFEAPLAEGATHVLVLRSRPACYRKPARSGLGDSIALRDNPALVGLLRDRHHTYNRQADELEYGEDVDWNGAHVLQVAVPGHARLIRRLEASGERVVDALRLGAKSMASAVLTEPIDLCWQPVVYRTAPGGDDLATRPLESPLPRRRVNESLGGSLSA